MAKEKFNRLLGACASVGLHGLAAAVLVFSLSGPATPPEMTGRLDVVWASVASGKDASLTPAPQVGHRKPAADSRFSATGEMQTARDDQPEFSTDVSADEKAAPDAATAFSGDRTAPPAEAPGHGMASGAVRAQAAPVAQQVNSSAYPRYRENPPPGYPETARQRGYEGVVLIAVEILTDGRVGKAVIRQSSGYAILDHTAVAAVRDWKFVPAKKSGVPYKTWAELPIKFVIRENTRS